MSQQNISEQMESQVQSTLDTPFSRELTHDEIISLLEFINAIPDIKQKLRSYDYYELPSMEWLQERGDLMLIQSNDLYALRFYAEGILSAVNQNKNGEYFCDQIEAILNILSGYDYMQLDSKSYFLMESYYDYECARIKDDIRMLDLINVIYDRYHSLIMTLNLDDFCYGYESELQKWTQDIEFLLFYWVHMNDYKKLFPNIDYIRDPQSNCPSKGYMILRNEFNEELLKSIPSNGKENGILLLKMAYKVQSYDPPMATKYVIKARANFLDCGFDQGIALINGFHVDKMYM